MIGRVVLGVAALEVGIAFPMLVGPLVCLLWGTVLAVRAYRMMATS